MDKVELRSRVEPIFQSLCLGFVQDEAAGSYTRETLDEIYRNAIYLLYRVLFLFYAEARGLLPTHDERYQEVGLAAVVSDARRRQQEGLDAADPYTLWKRLTKLCVVVDDGDESLGVRPYNGGLFSDTEKPYLKAHKIRNDYLAPTLYELGYVQAKSGTQPIDYRDLSVRHLGTLYEGLLEYRLNLVEVEPVVVRENNGKRTYIPQSQAGTIKKTETILDIGQVYFADDKGERKSSGSYYTPEDVVQYIVTNTVTPKLRERCFSLESLLDEVRNERAVAATPEERSRLEHYADQQALQTVERDLLGLRILDLAMGSAHFLVAAGQIVTNAIVETLNATTWANDTISTDPLIWKRRVVERCLYGVDMNPLAQELGKLALWLSSASVGKPLTFLDHHLKVGNSLYGTPLSRLSTLPTAKKDNANDLFQPIREQTIQSVLAELAKITGIDSDRIEDVKYKDEVHRTAIEFTRRLRDVANVWLGTLFGLQGDNDMPLDENEFFQLLQDVTRNYAPESWESLVRDSRPLHEARKIAEDEGFFHWELEFPDAVVDGTCRFDAIVTNPPYVGTPASPAVTALYQTAKCSDLYAWLFERVLQLTGDGGMFGTVVPLSLMFSRAFVALRHRLLESNLQLRLSSYDNIPDGLFNTGKSSDNTNKENSQRTTIAVGHRLDSPTRVETTDLLRWRHQDRHMLFQTLHFADTTGFCSKTAIPRIGNNTLAVFYRRLKEANRAVVDISASIYSESQRPPADAIFSQVPARV